jgi:protein phosphatase PTC1
MVEPRATESARGRFWYVLKLHILFLRDCLLVKTGVCSPSGIFLYHSVVVEVHDTKDRSILLAGIMDGHLGKGASNSVRENLPQYFSEELLRGAGTGDKTPVESLLQTAWEQTCDAYGLACTSEDACIAEYDPREGILMANTGSGDTAAGTTTCVVALDKNNGYLAVLNCGDSRGLVIDGEGELVFKTYDHKPDREIERFAEGINQGLNYGVPGCRMSRWYVPVGDFNYAVSRSLEGPFATSKGIVSTPDISTLQATAGTTVAVASDGLWEVMDSTEVANIAHRLRFKQSMSAGDAAKTLCSMALERGSTDNVSVVILYLD